MAVISACDYTVRRIARFGLTTRDADALRVFYEKALGCRHLTTDTHGAARRHLMSLGDELIELLQFDRPGKPSPDISPLDLAFQHFAIVVSDMDAAVDQLSRTSGWRALSTHGPEHLPQSSGGVTAFKFRDPEGHPLELLAFPPDGVPAHWRARLQNRLTCGIDHSAISVADTPRSVSFYEALGFDVVARSFNHGIEQERLDGIANPRVEVTALAPRHATPHIELLCYQTAAPRGRLEVRDGDVAASRLVLDMDPVVRATSGPAPGPATSEEMFIVDPDGHRLQVTPDPSRHRERS